MRSRYEQLFDQFQRFDEAHPVVWDEFRRLALLVIHSGRRHYSADALLHRVRWSLDFERKGESDGFKVNNNWAAFYARKFDACYPAYRGFFRNRAQLSKRVAIDDAAERRAQAEPAPVH